MAHIGINLTKAKIFSRKDEEVRKPLLDQTYYLYEISILAGSWTDAPIGTIAVRKQVHIITQWVDDATITASTCWYY